MFIGGACRYEQIPGTITIKAIEASKELGLYPDPVIVLFDFVPDPPMSRLNYRFPHWPSVDVPLHVGGGCEPPIRWIKAAKIAVGQRYRGTRNEIVQGTCTPVIYECDVFATYYDWMAKNRQ